MTVKISRRDFLKLIGFSAAGAATTAILTGCGRSKKETINITHAIDLSNPVNDPAIYHPEVIPLVLAATFVPSENITEYNMELRAQLLDLNNPNFIGNGTQRDPRLYLDWVTRSKAVQVNGTIDDWLLRGDSTTIDINSWSLVRSIGESPNEHTLVLKTIAEQGVGGDVKFIGYYQDIWQIPKSNILRRAMVVEFQGKQYMVKLQHLNSALEEADSLSALNKTNPKIIISPTSTFKLNKISTNRLTFSISDMVVSADGSPAQTLEAFISQGGFLTPLQREEMKAIYQANIKILMSSDSLKVGADSLQPRNIVFNQNGNLVVIDALSSRKTGLQIALKDGLVVSTDAEMNKQIILMRNILNRVGLTKAEIVKIESTTFTANQATASDLVKPGQQTLLTVVEENGTETIVPIANQADDAVFVPKTMVRSSFETFSLWLNRAAAAALGLVIGRNIATKVISTDPKIETILQPNADLHNRRQLDADLYIQMLNGPSNQFGDYLDAHTTNAINVDDLRTLVLRHRKINSMRAGLNLPQDNNRLRFRMVLSDSMSLEESDLWADVNDLGLIELHSKTLNIEENNGTLSAALLPNMTLLQNGETDQNIIRLQRDQFDSLDLILANDLLIPRRFEVLNTLNRLQENEKIDFWAVTSNNRIIYGKLIANNLEIRFLAEEDLTMPKYKVESINSQTGEIEIKEKGILRPVTIDKLTTP